MRVALLALFAGMASGAELLFASLNLARERDAAKIADEIQASPELRRADVLLFQEVAGQTRATNVAETVATRLRMFVVAVPSSADSQDQGLAILSRFPMQDASTIPLERFDLRFHSRIRFAIAVTLMIPEEPLRVWNLHLDSRINIAERVRQVTPVLKDAKDYEVGIIGGDFNTTHFQWLLNVIPATASRAQVVAVRSVLEQAGYRSTLPDKLVTFPFLGQHLDWIFARGIEARQSGVAEISFSDHHAVWSTFQLPAPSIPR